MFGYGVKIVGTKILQEVFGHPWVIETEGVLVKKYEPRFETKKRWFRPDEQVEVGKPALGSVWAEGNCIHYVDTNRDVRKITPECKPFFRIGKEDGTDGPKQGSVS